MRAKDILVGPLELRSGWRLLIFLAIVSALQAAFQEVVSLILQARGIVAPEGLYAIVFLVEDVITLVAVLIATWIMASSEHRKLSAAVCRERAPSAAGSGKARCSDMPASLL